MGKRRLYKYDPDDAPPEHRPVLPPPEMSYPGLGFASAGAAGTQVQASKAPGSLGQAGIYVIEDEPWLASRSYRKWPAPDIQDLAESSRQHSVIVANFGALGRTGTHGRGVLDRVGSFGHPSKSIIN